MNEDNKDELQKAKTYDFISWLLVIGLFFVLLNHILEFIIGFLNG